MGQMDQAEFAQTFRWARTTSSGLRISPAFPIGRAAQQWPLGSEARLRLMGGSR